MSREDERRRGVVVPATPEEHPVPPLPPPTTSSHSTVSSTSSSLDHSASRKKHTDGALTYLIAGGAAGAISRTCIAPIERIKIIFQVNKGGQYRHLLQQLVQEEGVLRLWKGNSAAVVRVVPYMATTFFAYEEYKVLFANVFDHRWPAVNESLAGSAAGITAVALTYPLDLVRARLAMQENAKAQPHLQYRYRGVFDALVSIPRQEGPAALYRGISAAVVGVVPYAGIKFSAYEALKRVAMTLFSKSEADLPVSVRMGCGGLAGLLAQTFTYPFDVLRRRAQTGRQPYPNVVVGIVQLAREEGVRRGLYRGLSLNYLKTLPNVMIYMSLYDIFKARLLKLSQHNRI